MLSCETVWLIMLCPRKCSLTVPLCDCMLASQQEFPLISAEKSPFPVPSDALCFIPCQFHPFYNLIAFPSNLHTLHTFFAAFLETFVGNKAA